MIRFSIEVLATARVLVPKSLSVNIADAPPLQLPREYQPKGKKTTDIVAQSDSAFLDEWGIHTLGDEDDDPLDCVLQNSTPSECEYIRKSRKPLQDHIPVKLKVGNVMALGWSIDFNIDLFTRYSNLPDIFFTDPIGLGTFNSPLTIVIG